MKQRAVKESPASNVVQRGWDSKLCQCRTVHKAFARQSDFSKSDTMHKGKLLDFLYVFERST